MRRILKGAPRTHVLIPDTSVLWHEDKKHAVNPDFDVFWSDHESLVAMELIVPDAVRQELLFQQTCSAGKAFERLRNATHRLLEIKQRLLVRQKFLGVAIGIDQDVATGAGQFLPCRSGYDPVVQAEAREQPHIGRAHEPRSTDNIDHSRRPSPRAA